MDGPPDGSLPPGGGERSIYVEVDVLPFGDSVMTGNCFRPISLDEEISDCLNPSL